MSNLKVKYEALKVKALNNWFTKDLVNDKMKPNEFIATVISETRDNESEMGLGMEFFDLLIEWSTGFKNVGSVKETVNNLNKTLI